ncbi:MAG: GspE/PulE family protein [Candidatus Omnitrophota bacterium]
MAKSLKERLIETLRESKLISGENLDKAIKLHEKKGGSLGRILVGENLISHRDLLVLLSQQLNIPPINLSKYRVEDDVIRLVPEKIAKQYKLLPISKLGNTITVAMSDPTDILAIDDIKAITKHNIDVVIAAESDLAEAVAVHYRKGADDDISEMIRESETADEIEVVDEDDNIDVSEITIESKKAPVVKLVGMILNEALSSRASDIHIEPEENELRIRYRIDGNLKEALTVPKTHQNAILARLKIMSTLDITENRLPQDGRFKISFRDRDVDFRVSVLPVTFGNKIVLRALDRSSLGIGLENLGYLPEPLADFKKAIQRPYGMILITGPTGSGKSTTLYSILNQINTADKNIITIEDPVEYQLGGITQIQANQEIGLTFATGLKSVLRQSPDIVMVGEIRDSETADIAIKASLTGQLVLSTLHTNDAPSAVTRLMDMGVEPFLIASSVVMTAGQRLLRKICPHCREECKIPGSVFERVGVDLRKYSVAGKTFYRGKGCKKCNQTGYYGRMGTLETFFVDDAIRDLIMKRASSDQIKRCAVSKGMLTLRENAFRKFVMGLTTLEEVLRVTSEE